MNKEQLADRYCQNFLADVSISDFTGRYKAFLAGYEAANKMTQPTQEQIHERAALLYQKREGYTFQLAELQLKVEALESLQRNAGEETDEELYRIFKEWVVSQQNAGVDYNEFDIFKAGRASLKK